MNVISRPAEWLKTQSINPLMPGGNKKFTYT